VSLLEQALREERAENGALRQRHQGELETLTHEAEALRARLKISEDRVAMEEMLEAKIQAQQSALESKQCELEEAIRRRAEEGSELRRQLRERGEEVDQRRAEIDEVRRAAEEVAFLEAEEIASLTSSLTEAVSRAEKECLEKREALSRVDTELKERREAERRLAEVEQQLLVRTPPRRKAPSVSAAPFSASGEALRQGGGEEETGGIHVAAAGKNNPVGAGKGWPRGSGGRRRSRGRGRDIMSGSSGGCLSPGVGCRGRRGSTADHNPQAQPRPRLQPDAFEGCHERTPSPAKLFGSGGRGPVAPSVVATSTAAKIGVASSEVAAEAGECSWSSTEGAFVGGEQGGATSPKHPYLARGSWGGAGSGRVEGVPSRRGTRGGRWGQGQGRAQGGDPSPEDIGRRTASKRAWVQGRGQHHVSRETVGVGGMRVASGRSISPRGKRRSPSPPKAFVAGVVKSGAGVSRHQEGGVMSPARARSPTAASLGSSPGHMSRIPRLCHDQGSELEQGQEQGGQDGYQGGCISRGGPGALTMPRTMLRMPLSLPYGKPTWMRDNIRAEVAREIREAAIPFRAMKGSSSGSLCLERALYPAGGPPLRSSSPPSSISAAYFPLNGGGDCGEGKGASWTSSTVRRAEGWRAQPSTSRTMKATAVLAAGGGG
ncbi:unnamed protein product, partial [Discosporangium mesarthrocarpum]